MADLKKTVEIIFGATDKTGSILTGISQNIDKTTASVSGITGPLTNVTTSLFKTEAAIIAVAAAYGGFAISKAIEFTNAQIELAKVLNETDPDVKSFTDRVIALSEQYGVASSEILEGIANFKQAGFTAEASAKLQKNALDLMIAGNVGASQASEILVASLKGFSVEADQAGRFIEALNNVSNNYATDLNELAVGMARISPVANKMGFSFEETTGLITPVIEVFRSGPEAANALRTGLLKLIDDSKPVGDALARLGVSQFDLNGEMRSGKDIFIDVATAFQTMDENQKLVTTSQLVGTEQAARMVTVFDNLALVQDVTAVAMEKTGSVAIEVGLRLDSAGKSIDIAIQSFNNLAKSVGDELLPSFGEITGGATDIIKAFRDVVESGGLAPLFDKLDAQGTEFATFLSKIADALPDAFKGLDFSSLLDAFANLKGAINSLFGDLDLTTASGLQEALQNLVDFVGLLTNASAGAVKGLEPLVSGIISFLEALADSDGATQDFIGFLGGMGTAVNTIIPLLGFLASGLATVGGALSVLGALKSVSVLKDISLSLTSISPTNLALVAAIGAVTFAINENITAYEELQARELSIQKDEEHLNATRLNIADRLGEISKATGITVTSMEEFNKALDEGTIVLDNSEVGYRNGTKALVDYDKVVSDVAGSQDFWGDSVASVTDTLIDMGVSIDGSTLGLKSLKQQQLDINNAIAVAEKQGLSYNVVIKDGVSQLVTWGQTNEEVATSLDTAGKAAEDLAKSQQDAIDKSHELELQLNDLASNEKIAAMEFTANIKVAQFEAQSKQIVAQLNAMADGLESNNNLVGELFSHEAPNWDKFGFATEDAIQDANKRANELNQSIIDMNNSQIANLDAQTKNLADGGSEITINAENLAPELQALLRSLIDNIRIEAVNNSLEILI